MSYKKFLLEYTLTKYFESTWWDLWCRHVMVATFQCEKCHTCWKNGNSLYKHQKLHRKDVMYHKKFLNQDKLTCVECKQILPSEKALNQHKLTHIEGYDANPKAACNICGKFVNKHGIKVCIHVIKVDQPHLHPTDYRHTDKHFGLVITVLCSKHTVLPFAVLDKAEPLILTAVHKKFDLNLWPWPRPWTLTHNLWPWNR